jgi:signal transduction histidine kinase
MIRFFVSSLKGQMILVLMAGLLVSHAVNLWIYSERHRETVFASDTYAIARRAVEMVALVREVPAAWREGLVAAADGNVARIALVRASGLPASLPPADPEEDDLARFIARSLDAPDGGGVRVFLVDGPGAPALRQADPGLAFLDAATLAVADGRRRLVILVAVEDGLWLRYAADIAAPLLARLKPLVIDVVLVALAFTLMTLWMAERTVAPVSRLTAAARDLGDNLDAAPLAEVGPQEVKAAARAFNAMQHRLRRLVGAHTRMLGEVSHDLRTPIAILRLRIERLADREERETLLRTVDEIALLSDGILQAARETGKDEPTRPVDLASLVASICDDLAETGQPVRLVAAEPVIVRCRLLAITRAVRNVIDNAVRHGGGGDVRIAGRPGGAAIVVEDSGPGIAAAELPDVFTAYYRSAASAARHPTGSGLGLTIARAVVESHGGAIEIDNRPGGGVRVEITLPS